MKSPETNQPELLPSGSSAASAAAVRTVITVLALVALFEGAGAARVEGLPHTLAAVTSASATPGRNAEERFQPRDPGSIASQLARAARVIFNADGSLHAILLPKLSGGTPLVRLHRIALPPLDLSVHPLDRIDPGHLNLPPPRRA